MHSRTLLPVLFSLAILSALGEEPPDHTGSTLVLHQSASPLREPGAPVKTTDACDGADIPSNSTTPTWDAQANTTPCGALETDNLFTRQPLGPGVSQGTLTTTAKYGLTPHLEVRWVLPGRMFQNGAGSARLAGTTDQWFGVLFRFHDQGGRTPDLAMDYAIKLPTSNPSKGFGTGYTDHQFTFIASRDFGPNHVDMNALALVAGGPKGPDPAAQFGAAFTHSFTSRLMGTVEAFGGSQPATTRRYAAAFVGGAWSVRPWLALNGGVLRAFTGGAPARQYLVGFIYTVRPRIAAPAPSRLAHMLGI
jgi:hypothetical protein